MPNRNSKVGTAAQQSDAAEVTTSSQTIAKPNVVGSFCPNRKLLIQLRTKLEFYKKLDKKISKVLNAELEVDDWSSEVYFKKMSIEKELEDLKMEMDLSDEEWDEDETVG